MTVHDTPQTMLKRVRAILVVQTTSPNDLGSRLLPGVRKSKPTRSIRRVVTTLTPTTPTIVLGTTRVRRNSVTKTRKRTDRNTKKRQKRKRRDMHEKKKLNTRRLGEKNDADKVAY